MRCLLFCFLICVGPAAIQTAEGQDNYLLAPELAAGDTTAVKVNLELGGQMYQINEGGEQKLPLSVRADLAYDELLLSWSKDGAVSARSLRDYGRAEVNVQKGKRGHRWELAPAKRKIIVESGEGKTALASTSGPLTRDQYDLLNVIGNSLVLNRLLPHREVAKDDTWDHDAVTIGSMLDMDNVAVCEVKSVVTGCEHRQVQIRMAGSVQGTIDGAPTELELRAAYLFHQDRKRITKFNLAIKEKRAASQLVHGLDVVAKIAITVSPTETQLDPSDAEEFSEELTRVLSYEAPQRGYRFLHDANWYVVAEQSDRVSLRSLHDGNVTAHCSLTTLPSRSEGRETTLEEFERDVREMLGEHLESISTATNWTTEQGHECLGVVAHGATEGIPIEWRYYLIWSPNRPRVSLSVTVEQAQLEAFDDADRQLVDTMKLLMQPVAKTATKAAEEQSR